MRSAVAMRRPAFPASTRAGFVEGRAQLSVHLSTRPRVSHHHRQQVSRLRTPVVCRASSSSGSAKDSSLGQQAAQKFQEAIENARPHAERLGMSASVKCAALRLLRTSNTCTPILPCTHACIRQYTHPPTHLAPAFTPVVYPCTLHRRHRMKQTAVLVDDELRRAAAKVDRNFGVRDKAAQAADGCACCLSNALICALYTT